MYKWKWGVKIFHVIRIGGQKLKKYLHTLGPFFSSSYSMDHTAKTLYRKFETNIPRNETAQPRSRFPHSGISEKFIYCHDRSTYFAAAKQVDRSLTDK